MSRNFEGFLLAYCRELTGLQTASLKKMLRAAANDSPRAAEPLLLLAFAQGREGYLLRCATSTSLATRYAEFTEAFRASGRSLDAHLAKLPDDDRFAKAHRAWVAECTQLERDRATLSRVGAAMRALLEEKGVSRAEACRALGLDKGNFYAFLKGDGSRLSRGTAMAAYRKLAELEPA